MIGLNIGSPECINFGTNGKLIVLNVPILKHFRVFIIMLIQLCYVIIMSFVLLHVMHCLQIPQKRFYRTKLMSVFFPYKLNIYF